MANLALFEIECTSKSKVNNEFYIGIAIKPVFQRDEALTTYFNFYLLAQLQLGLLCVEASGQH